MLFDISFCHERPFNFCVIEQAFRFIEFMD